MRKLYLSTLFTLFLTLSLIAPVFALADTPAISSEVALKMLIDGNQRFLTEKYASAQLGKARRVELTKGQHPFAVIVSCSDSRVPPEILFDQGLGDLFVVRVAGNVLDSIELGSVEYAVEHLNAKLIVILGHENCGAVKATIDGGEVPPNIGAIAAKIQPAVAAAKATNSANLYEAAADINISNMVAVLKGDPILTHIPGIKIVGAKYHLESGGVEFIK